MRKLIAVALALCLTACDSATGLDTADLVGDWEIELVDAASCGDFGPATLYFTVEETSGSESLLNVVSEWGFEPSIMYNWLLTGNFNLDAKTAELRLWHTPLSTGSYFRGRIESDGSIVGTIRDPIPGYRRHYSLRDCTYQATGRRVGPPSRSM